MDDRWDHVQRPQTSELHKFSRRSFIYSSPPMCSVPCLLPPSYRPRLRFPYILRLSVMLPLWPAYQDKSTWTSSRVLTCPLNEAHTRHHLLCIKKFARLTQTSCSRIWQPSISPSYLAARPQKTFLVIHMIDHGFRGSQSLLTLVGRRLPPRPRNTQRHYRHSRDLQNRFSVVSNTYACCRAGR